LSNNFRLHLIDLPGHGLSAPIGSFTLDSVCDVLARHVPKRAHWLGWSLGGLLALAFAARHPQRVERLIMLASNPCFVANDAWPQGMARNVLESFAEDLLQDHQAMLTRFLGLIARGALDNAVLRELRRAVRAVPSPHAPTLRGGLAILRDTDLRPSLDALSMPTLWVGGVRDTLVPITALRRVHEQYPHMPLHEVVQAGHAPFISHPQETAAAISEFLL
jgi:pimeloyl-[acyl-carrier protein] methyl ester esterase